MILKVALCRGLGLKLASAIGNYLKMAFLFMYVSSRNHLVTVLMCWRIYAVIKFAIGKLLNYRILNFPSFFC